MRRSLRRCYGTRRTTMTALDKALGTLTLLYGIYTVIALWYSRDEVRRS